MVKWILVVCLPLAGCFDHPVDHSSEYKELGEAVGYSCGYVDGQIDTSKMFGVPMKESGNACDDVRASALKHGFKRP